MNKVQAHEILEQRKQGFAVPLHLVNSALVVCGDIGMACPPCKTTWVEGPSMAQGEGIRELFYSFVERDNPRFNPTNEGTQ